MAYEKFLKKLCVEENSHFTPVLESKLQKLGLPFNFNFEGDKELCDQYDFSSHDETTNNNEPTHFKRKRKSCDKCTLSCFCKCILSCFCRSTLSFLLLIYCFSNINTCSGTATVDSTPAVISVTHFSNTPIWLLLNFTLPQINTKTRITLHQRQEFCHEMIGMK